MMMLYQRGELASDRARDSDIKSLILDAMSQHRDDNGDSGEVTTEARIQTMRSEISSAAVEHRNLVAQLTSSASASSSANNNNVSDTRSDNDTDSSETRSLASSSD